MFRRSFTPPSPLGLSTYRWNNNIKSLVILAACPFLLLAVVVMFFVLCGVAGMDSSGLIPPYFYGQFGFFSTSGAIDLSTFAQELTLRYAPLVFIIAGVWIVIGFLFNQGIMQSIAGGKPIERTEQPELYNLVENLCISRGLKMPSLFIMDTPTMNAFASGLTDSSYAITVTRGLLEKLDKDELEAVLAHELTHIMNRDVRLMIIMFLFGGMLSFFAGLLWRVVRYAPSSDSSSKKRGGLVIFLLIAALVLSVGYGISALLRLALSRRREYLADAGAVDLTKRPDSLIHALEKISGQADNDHLPNAVRAMMIENPPGLFSLFDTHPPIAARIAVLRRLGGLPEEGESIIPSAG